MFPVHQEVVGTVDSLEVSSATKTQLKYLIYIRRLYLQIPIQSLYPFEIRWLPEIVFQFF